MRPSVEAIHLQKTCILLKRIHPLVNKAFGDLDVDSKRPFLREASLFLYMIERDTMVNLNPIYVGGSSSLVQDVLDDLYESVVRI